MSLIVVEKKADRFEITADTRYVRGSQYNDHSSHDKFAVFDVKGTDIKVGIGNTGIVNLFNYMKYAYNNDQMPWYLLFDIDFGKSLKRLLATDTRVIKNVIYNDDLNSFSITYKDDDSDEDEYTHVDFDDAVEMIVPTYKVDDITEISINKFLSTIWSMYVSSLNYDSKKTKEKDVENNIIVLVGDRMFNINIVTDQDGSNYDCFEVTEEDKLPNYVVAGHPYIEVEFALQCGVSVDKIFEKVIENNIYVGGEVKKYEMKF